MRNKIKRLIEYYDWEVIFALVAIFSIPVIAGIVGVLDIMGYIEPAIPVVKCI